MVGWCNVISIVESSQDWCNEMQELGPAYVRTLKEAVGTAVERQRRRRLQGPLLLPGLCLPKALAPLLPIYLQGVLQVRRPGLVSGQSLAKLLSSLLQMLAVQELQADTCPRLCYHGILDRRRHV